MEIISDPDVVRISNAVVLKLDLGINIRHISQCSSDFVLVLYHAIMGEFPSGTLTDCSTIDSQIHNIACVIDSLANEYLHVDLSHISPTNFVEGEPTTVYNLLEILDGLLEFMLEHISTASDSGDEGDVDSDQLSMQSHLKRKEIQTSRDATNDPLLDTSTCTNELIACDLINDDMTSIKNKKEPENDLSLDEDGERFVPLLPSESPSSMKDDWVELKRSDPSTSQPTPVSDDMSKTIPHTASNETASLIQLGVEDDVEPRPMLIESLNYPTDSDNTHRILSDLTNSMTQSLGLGSTYKIADKPEPEVTLDTSIKGSGILVSDIPSEGSQASSIKAPSVTLDDGKHDDEEEYGGTVSSSSSEGVDVADGIPRPTLDDRHGVLNDLGSTYTRDRATGGSEIRPSSEAESSLLPPDRDWEALLDNLQKTVEESKKIREKYFASPMQDDVLPYYDRRYPHKKVEASTFDDDELMTPDVAAGTTTAGSDLLVDSFNRDPRQKNVRFEDTISTKTADDLKAFKDVLQKEKELLNVKNKILSSSYRDHLDEVEDVERKKIKPLVERAESTEKYLQEAIKRQYKRDRKSQQAKQTGIKKELAAAAKWKSWQSPHVRFTPQIRTGRVKKKIGGNMIIGEHDLLPTLMSEFPGLELSSNTLNNVWRKQFRQIERLTRSENSHTVTKRKNEKQLLEAHRRHQLLTDIMSRDHEHNRRVRDAKERADGRKEAIRSAKEKRQQSARIRRYYRDYQLQMRARMLKRRTREERLFRNLFEEGLNIQRSRLNDLRQYARDKRGEHQKRQRDEIESLENYYKDQFTLLAETLGKEKNDLRTRDRAQTELLRKMKGGLREKMESEIKDLQERIIRDDDDIYFRELEADRIRRQLQMAAYHGRFRSSMA